MAAERRFRAMGSDAHLIVVGNRPDLIGTAMRRIDDLEQRWSRFRQDSEVSLLNRRAGAPVRVSPDTRLLVARALDAWRLSGGAFDPTLLGAVIRAGYDRSFDVMGATSSQSVSLLAMGSDEIVIDGDTVCIPAGTGFDPGGIGKGLAADLVANEVMAAGAEGVCVNLGGDLRLRGFGPTGASWTVAIEHSRRDRPVALVGLADGAVATSTTLRRCWLVDGQPRHHLIDPRTGLPSDSDVQLASIISADAWMAEALAKAVLLAGTTHPFDILGGTGAEGLVVDEVGHVHSSAGFAAFLGLTGLRPGEVIL